METLLELQNVTKIFTIGLLGKTSIKAVDNVSFEVGRGEILGILGESGSGKSTIARLILKIIQPTSGKYYLMVETSGRSMIENTINTYKEYSKTHIPVLTLDAE